MIIMTQAQVISRWHQEEEKLLLTAVTEDWMRGFILRLQDSSSALRTNSKQTLRKHRRQILPASSMTTWMKELHPSERRAAKSQKLRNHVLSHPGVFLPPLAPSISLFFFFFSFFLHASETTVPSIHWTEGWVGDSEMSVSWTVYL